MTNERWDEARAAEVLQAIHGGEVDLVDPGGGSMQLFDLRMRLPSGSTVAVEVTSVVDGALLAVDSEIGKKTWESEKLEFSWIALCTRGARVKKMHATFLELFERLESMYIREFACKRPPDTPAIGVHPTREWYAEPSGADVAADQQRIASALQGLHDAGFIVGRVIGSSRPGRVTVTTGPLSASVWSDDLRDALEAELWKVDNRKKLGESKDHERSLFLWVSHTAGSAAAAIQVVVQREWAPPTRLPVVNFPPEVDRAWVAAAWSGHNEGELTAALFQVDRNGWRQVGPVAAESQ